ncbi:choice-of-anchor I family protein [Pseudolysinimonas sp.]|uniref:choice-of-anchor I family protein n=1 Tax=Pseudolysinimonas sp. TaxID=2680009 RepID=UPI00286CB6FE|nr:choice-of-anchor I family protein [Pseudolysinimonas sp.]
MTRLRSAALAAATLIPLTALALAPLPVAAEEEATPVFSFVGRYANGGAEVSAVLGNKLFVIGEGTTLDVVDISDPALPVLLRTVDLAAYGASISSVATTPTGVGAARVAVTLPAADKTAPGTVVLLNPGGSPLRSAQVGANPDMVTFDESGERVLVANEGEPDSYAPKDDAEGSVSVVDVALLLTKKTAPSAVTTIGFTDFNIGASRHDELPLGTRVFGPGATVAEDLEPEYITVDGDRAYVTLQENNSIAELDLVTNSVVAIRALALKDHSLPGNGLDASDRDSAINIRNWPIFGAPLPDGIASYTIDGETYLITANEGDARADWPGYAEERSFAQLKPLLDPAEFTPAEIAALEQRAALGRLNFTRASGDADGDGLYEQLVAFGTRSVSIWATDGELVGDTGDDLEQATAVAIPGNFNATNDANNFDNRSDNKGPEPEGVAVGEIDGRSYAFVALERPGGFAVFDVTDPGAPTLVQYVTSRDFTVSPTSGATDSGPEVIHFVAATDSPTRVPLVILNNEISHTVAIFSLAP